MWGLNDKDQLGGVKGSKVKVPVFSPSLSALRPVHIAGGSKTLFIVSHDGKVILIIFLNILSNMPNMSRQSSHQQVNNRNADDCAKWKKRSKMAYPRIRGAGIALL